MSLNRPDARDAAHSFSLGMPLVSLMQVVGAVVALGAALAWMAMIDAALRGYAADPPFVDWVTYANAFDRFVEGRPLYDPRQLTGPHNMPTTVLTGYSYPPPSILLFASFAGRALGLVAWLVLSATLLWSAAAALVQRAFRVPIMVAIALTGASLALFLPAIDGMATANVNVALAGVVGWCWIRREDRWIAPVSAVLAFVKLFPAFLVALPARRYGWRAIAMAALTGVVILVVTLPFTGFKPWQEYVVALGNAEPACWGSFPTVGCVVGPLLGPQGAKLLGIGVALTLFLVALTVKSDFLSVAAIVFAMLAPVTDGWMHYALFVYMLALIGIEHVVRTRRVRVPSTGDAEPRRPLLPRRSRASSRRHHDGSDGIVTPANMPRAAPGGHL